MTSKNIIYLVIILLAATLLTIVSTYFTYKNSLTAFEDSIKLHAIGIAVSLEPSLAKINKEKNILSEIVSEDRWEGIAYLALYNKAGVTIKHSNENLINKVIDDDLIKKTFSAGEAIDGYITLGTGESIFVLNFPITLDNELFVLRVALHKYPFQKIIRQARFQAISSLFLILILWVMGFFFIRTLKQSEALNKVIIERQRLAMLGEMSSILAHEIRNPLGSIKGFAQLILEGSKNINTHPQEMDDYLRIIITETNRLESLTDELLLFAKTSDYKPDNVDIYALISECVKGLQTNIDSKQIEFRVSSKESFFIKTDYNKLKQILINIIQNSIEAIEEKGLIEITTEIKGKSASITVKDNGIGMNEELLKNAFKPFFTTKTKGTGLGLSIVEGLVKSLGGEIQLESSPAKGTKVVLSIPKEL